MIGEVIGEGVGVLASGLWRLRLLPVVEGLVAGSVVVSPVLMWEAASSSLLRRFCILFP